MNHIAQENPTHISSHATPRFDIYSSIHKALRAVMADTLMALGRLDPADVQEISLASQRATELLDLCVAHLNHENTFVHAAMESRAPGSSDHLTTEHEDHLAHIGVLKRNIAALCASPTTQTPARAHALYQAMALFVADNFQHMHTEETVHNALLWALYTDAELLGIHNALLASIAPADMMHILRWMIPSLTPVERAAVLADMQSHRPVDAFDAVLNLVRPYLYQAEWNKLNEALGRSAVRHLTAA